MKKIEWKSKLTSRKFWVAIVTFITSIITAFGASDSAVAQVTGIIMAGAAAIAYIIGEGLVDAAKQKTDTSTAETTDKTEGTD